MQLEKEDGILTWTVDIRAIDAVSLGDAMPDTAVLDVTEMRTDTGMKWCFSPKGGAR